MVRQQVPYHEHSTVMELFVDHTMQRFVYLVILGVLEGTLDDQDLAPVDDCASQGDPLSLRGTER